MSLPRGADEDDSDSSDSSDDGGGFADADEQLLARLQELDAALFGGAEAGGRAAASSVFVTRDGRACSASLRPHARPEGAEGE